MAHAKKELGDKLPAFDQGELESNIRNRNREIRQQIDPDTRMRVELLTKKQLLALQKQIKRGLGKF